MKKALFVLFLLAFAAYGQQKRIAVINTIDNADSIAYLDLDHLTGKLREIAGNVLPKDKYGIMTQQSIIDRLGSQDNAAKECNAASCLADLGRKISAAYIAQGYVGRFGGRLTLKVELYDSKSGNLVGSFTDASQDLFGLITIMDAKASDMFKKILDEDKPPPVAVEQPPPAPVAPPPAAVAEPVPQAKPETVPADYAGGMSGGGKTADLENAVDIELGFKAPPEEKKVDPQVNSGGNKSFWVALALDITGAAAIGYGIVMNEKSKKEYDKYSSASSQANMDSAWKNAEDAKSTRNISYIIGGVLLAGGLGVHIWF